MPPQVFQILRTRGSNRQAGTASTASIGLFYRHLPVPVPVLLYDCLLSSQFQPTHELELQEFEMQHQGRNSFYSALEDETHACNEKEESGLMTIER